MVGDEDPEGDGVYRWCAWYGVTTSGIFHCTGAVLQALPAALSLTIPCPDVS